jgi:hypothetical protein
MCFSSKFDRCRALGLMLVIAMLYSNISKVEAQSGDTGPPPKMRRGGLVSSDPSPVVDKGEMRNGSTLLQSSLLPVP